MLVFYFFPPLLSSGPEEEEEEEEEDTQFVSTEKKTKIQAQHAPNSCGRDVHTNDIQERNKDSW